MKIFQINSVCGYGSTGNIAVNIAETLHSCNNECLIAYGQATTSYSQSFRIGTVLENDWHNLFYSRILGLQGLGTYHGTKLLIKKIIEYNPDIIHLHNIHGNYLNYPLLFKYLIKSKIPVVWTLHDCWSFTGHCAHYSLAKCYKWQTECKNCPRKNANFPSLFDTSNICFNLKRKYFTGVKNLTLVPVSNWLAGELKRSFFKDTPIKVINNGIDLQIFKSSRISKKDLGLHEKFTILGVSGGWPKTKGLSEFFKLRSILSEDFQIIIIGLTKKQIYNLPKGIIGMEKTKNVRELVDYYSIADVFFNSTWEDTFPTVNLEALACGTPIITYRTGGSTEAVNSNTGFVVNQGDVNSVVECIEKIKVLGKKSFSDKCRERAEQLYDKHNCYMSYIDLYESIINNLKNK